MVKLLGLKVKLHAVNYKRCIWNSFYFCLKLSQRIAVYYAVSVFLNNNQTYIQSNQISTQFGDMPSDLENYLTLLQAENKANDNKNNN